MYTIVNILAYGFIIAIGSVVGVLLTKGSGDKSAEAPDTQKPAFRSFRLTKATGPNALIFISILIIGILSIFYRLLLQPNMKEFFKSDKKYNEAGLLSLQKGNYKQALTEFNNAINKNPKNYLAVNNRGIAYCYLGQNYNARMDFKKALQVNDTFRLGYINLAELETKENNLDEAMLAITKVIELGSKEYRVYADRGYIYEMQEQYKEALQDYINAIELAEGLEMTVTDKANIAGTHYHCAMIYQYYGDRQKAKAEVAKALELGFPKDQDFLSSVLNKR